MSRPEFMCSHEKKKDLEIIINNQSSVFLLLLQMFRSRTVQLIWLTGRKTMIKVRSLEPHWNRIWKLKRKRSGRSCSAAVAPAAPLSVVVARWSCWWLVGGVGGVGVGAQRSPLGWAMGSSQRLAAVAAVSHARHYYNHTQPEVVQSEATHYTVNIFFVRLVSIYFFHAPSFDYNNQRHLHGL